MINGIDSTIKFWSALHPLGQRNYWDNATASPPPKNRADKANIDDTSHVEKICKQGRCCGHQ